MVMKLTNFWYIFLDTCKICTNLRSLQHFPLLRMIHLPDSPSGTYNRISKNDYVDLMS